MTENLRELEQFLGHAALLLWPELPREVQEKLFETAVPIDPVIRNRLAIVLHNRYPRTALSQYSRRSRTSKHCALLRLSVSQISRGTKTMPQPQSPVTQRAG